MLRGVAVLILASTQVAGCRRPEGEHFGTTRPRHPPDELWINNSSEAEWLDPGRISRSIGGEGVWNTFAGLVEWHPKTLEPMPGVADRLHDAVLEPEDARREPGERAGPGTGLPLGSVRAGHGGRGRGRNQRTFPG